MRALTIISIFLKPTNHISYAGKIYLNTVIVITGLLLILLKMAGIQVMDLLSKLVFMWQTLMVNWRPLTIQMTDDILCIYISLHCFPRLCFPFFLLFKHSHSTVQVLLLLCNWNLTTKYHFQSHCQGIQSSKLNRLQFKFAYLTVNILPSECMISLL